MSVSKPIFYLWLSLYIPFALLAGFYFYRQHGFNTEKLTKNVRGNIGKPFPFEYIFDLNVQKIDSTILKREYTIIDFWFGSCPPCIAEMKKFQSVLTGNENKVSIVSISIDEPKIWKNLFHSKNTRYDFLKQKMDNWSHAVLMPSDTFVSASNYIVSKFTTNRFPCYFVLNKNGIITAAPVSAVDFIKVNCDNASPYFLYLQSQVNEQGFFYLSSIIFVFYSGVFWILAFILLYIITLLRYRSKT